jgi:hypothetical protein
MKYRDNFTFYTNNKRINLISLAFFDLRISFFKNQKPCQILSVKSEICYIQLYCNEGLL